MKESAALRCRDCGSGSLKIRGRGARGRRFTGDTLARELDGGQLFHCASCDLLMRHPVLSPKQYSDLYGKHDGQLWKSETLRPDQICVIEFIHGWLPVGGSVLDVGCSSGDLLQGLGPKFTTYGVEPSIEASAKAAAAGVQVLCSTVGELKGRAERFDVIVAVDVIEHVESPLAFVQEMAHLLKPNGRVVISTGNARAQAWRWAGCSYYYVHLFEHISFISPRWCEGLSRQGFDVTILTKGFVHHDAERLAPKKLLKQWLVFALKLVLARAERVLLLPFPSRARRLGPRIMVGVPGLFRDHFMASFSRPQGARH